MRLKYDRFADKPSGYTMHLSARDTYEWAHKAGAAWPCSELADHRCMVDVDRNGLCNFTIDGQSVNVDEDIIGYELEACVGDYLPRELRHLWPCWEGAVKPYDEPYDIADATGDCRLLDR